MQPGRDFFEAALIIPVSAELPKTTAGQRNCDSALHLPLESLRSDHEPALMPSVRLAAKVIHLSCTGASGNAAPCDRKRFSIPQASLPQADNPAKNSAQKRAQDRAYVLRAVVSASQTISRMTAPGQKRLQNCTMLHLHPHLHCTAAMQHMDHRKPFLHRPFSTRSIKIPGDSDAAGSGTFGPLWGMGNMCGWRWASIPTMPRKGGSETLPDRHTGTCQILPRAWNGFTFALDEPPDPWRGSP